MNMLHGKLRVNLTIGLMALLGFTACKKTNNIGQDNDTAIATPHTVLAGSFDGQIVKTNDGRTFNQLFPVDGATINMISAAGPNVLMLKAQNLFLSDNNGRNFNVVNYTDFNPQPWRYWVLDCPSHNRVYMASNNDYGVAFSADSGKTWNIDTKWEENTAANIRMTSFGQLNNGTAYAFNDEYNVLFKRENADANWNRVLIEGVFPAASAFFLTSNTKDLFIVDHAGLGGAWYSNDQGTSWKQFATGELPTDGSVKFVGAGSSYSDILAVATEKDVYFASSQSGFQKANTGLKSGTTIYGITSKYNVYKNGKTVNFLYIATSDGMFRSDDGGFVWDKVSFNQYDQAYKSIY